ncbi:outer membrane protein assembly factor BamA [Rhodobacter calidifons]|uniref:Outer membrane protein assembly factor BamA n=1 Tax=Rhodobacter calidifons TaxID=2715277 RepID=A0ABX0G7V1_9RHOB|nr:outer membrane protein assembly factor BamA [Rhodobacter calidifons]NHB77357.1 outer membrane protein assembly factor BamA [Rhodobacter calidifons]
MTQRAAQGRTARARSGARLLATAVFLGAATASQPFLQPAHAQVYSFSNVTIEGNERVDAATILNYAGIRRGQELSAGALNDAYQRILNSNLFETVELLPQGSTLVIRVREYPIVNVISIEGNKRLKDEKLAELIKSQPRRVYSPAQAEADAAAMAEAYRVGGRLAATVTPKIIRRSENRVDLVFEITEGRVVENERISFVGNKAFSDRRLRQVLATKQAGLLRTLIQRDTFVAERLELDRKMLTDFYQSRGFIDFQVVDASAELSRERDATFVTFTVREGLSYKIGKVTTVSEVEGLDTAEFEAVQRIRTGQTYSPLLIDNNITRMETLALKKGLNFIRVEPRITRDNRNQAVDIEFAVVRGQRIFVERIDIEGNTTTLDQVVRRQFRTSEGDPFNPREIRQAAERIRALGFFSDAQVNADQGSAPDQVVVNVDVEEQPTGSLNFGVSYSVANGTGFNIGFSESNFLGRGQRLSLSISTASSNQNSSFSFTEPAFLGRDMRFSIGAFYRTSESDFSVYDTRNIGFNTGIGFAVGEQSTLDLRIGASEDKLYNYTGDSPIIIAEEAEGARRTAFVGYTYEFDNRITGLNPKGGVLLRFGQDFAGLGGDNSYIKTTALALAETKVLNEEVTLRAIVEGGAITSLGGNVTRVTDRFFGNGKVRGFEPNGYGPRDLGAANQDALGGNMFAVARFEADFPLGLPEEYGISGGAFFDVGSVWSLDNTAGFGGAEVDDGFNPRATVGLSLFWTTPIGPLRFNFTRALVKEDYDKEQTFDLTVQTRF